VNTLTLRVPLCMSYRTPELETKRNKKRILAMLNKLVRTERTSFVQEGHTASSIIFIIALI